MATLQEQLNEKLLAEYNEFIDSLMTLSPEEIIEKSYEKVFKEDICYAIEDSPYLSDEKAEALLKLDYPLDALYNEWLDTDLSYMEDLRIMIDSFARNEVKLNDVNKYAFNTKQATTKFIGEYLVEQEKDLGNGDSLCLCVNMQNVAAPYMVCKSKYNSVFKTNMPASVFTTKSHDEAKASFEIRSKNAEKEARQKESELEM